MAEDSILRRKQDHIRIALEERVVVRPGGTGFADYRFEHCALPEIALCDISLGARFLGHTLGAPLLVSSMTGGTPQAAKINRNLAAGAQAFGLAMGLGSTRAAIEDPSCAWTYSVRDLAPDVFLFANLGAVQLNYGFDSDTCRRAVDVCQADGLILHLNPLQEALQPGGNTDFGGLLQRIEKVCRALSVPVIAKEVGWGLSAQVVKSLVDAGVAAVDVAGAGGTSWSEIEGFRSHTSARQRLARDFDGWGIPTAECVRAVRDQSPNLAIVASGGIQSGVDAAKAIALGADIVGIARPLLSAADLSEESAIQEMERIVDGLRIAIFCAGARNVAGLRAARLARA